MILKKITPNKLLMLVWFISLFTVGFFIFRFSQPAEAVNTCGFNAGSKTGAFTLGSNCSISNSFGSGFEGVDTGDLTVTSGKQIVIGSGAALVLSPNSQLIINKPSNPAGAIVFTDNTSQIIKGSLCAQDADADGYADKTPYSGQAEPTFFYAISSCPTSPVNYTRKGLLNSLTQLDCVSASASAQKIDCVKSRVNGEWSNVGTCGQYTPGIQVRTRTWTATVNTQSDCGGTACGSLSGSEDDYTLSCGTCTPGATKYNYCGEGACASSQLVTCQANGTWPTDCTPGTAETDSAFCSRLGKNCNSFTGVDNCLASRTANCGSCTNPQTCGGSGTPNVCSCTDTTWTPAVNAICTPATGGPATFTQTSNCGATRQSVGTQVCCTSGYQDYDKDGYGTGTYGCYAPTVTYNIVSNADDCNDSDSNVYPGRTVTTFCGVGTCGSSGTDTCNATGGAFTHTVPCVTSSAACCEANGTYKAANTGVNTCQKCTGSAATPTNQTSSEDLLNKCTTGLSGTLTACQSNNCSGTGDSCGFVGSGTSCRASAGTCDSAETCTGSAFTCPIDSFLSNATVCASGSFNSPANGSCQRTAVDTKCSGSAAACNGSTVNRYENAATAGNVWNGSAWAAASASNTCGLSAYLCSTQQIYQNFYGCNTSGTCDNATNRGTTNGASCGGGENSRCVASNGSCQNLCSDGLDNDSDGFTDGADPDCGAVCTSGDCCNTGTGQYKTAGTLIGTCKKCTGTSNTSVFQTSSEDLGGNCTTGAAGSATACQSNNCSGTSDSCGFTSGNTCRTSAGVCDSTETCSGASFSCPIDSFLSNSNICSTGSFNNPVSGSCQRVATDQYCSGGAAACSGSTVNRYDNAPTAGNVWNGTAWAASSLSNTCGLSGYLCNVQQVYQNIYGCNTGGSCDNATSRGTTNGASCGGGENSRCLAGNASCQNNCGNGIDDDGDGFTDSLDTDCGAVCTSGDCCNTATGQYKTAGTSISTCKKCTGSSNTSVLQTAAEDLGGNCTTGAAGSATSCQSNTCSGTGDSCGFLGAGTSCRGVGGVCDSAETCTGSAFSCPIDSVLSNSTICNTGSFDSPASGSCRRTAVDTKCSGSGVLCNGTTANRYDDGSANQVWNGSSWVAAAIGTNCNVSGYLCSGQQIYRNYFGCTGAGACSGTAAGSSNGSLCAGESATSKCVAGNSTCQTNCSDGSDNDSDGYTDGQDTGCGGCGQCTSGACCNTTTGCFIAANTLVGTCQKCTGSSGAPANQTAAEDLGGNCTTGAAGSATACQSNTCSGSGDSCGYVGAGTSCRASGGVCDSAETCTGSAYSCPIDSYFSNSTICAPGSYNTPASGACSRSKTDQYCTGSASACTGSSVTTYDNGSANQVWNGSSWVAASIGTNCNVSGYLCSGQQIYQNYFGCTGGASTSAGSCSGTAAGSNNGALCSGESVTSKCVAGNSTCQTNCSDSSDNDGDGYTDLQDTGCGGGGQCTSGDCCDIPNGRYKAANTLISTCKKCTGASNTSVLQTAAEDLGGNCTTGAAGSATACQSNTCSGSGDSCGYVGAGTSCRGSLGICDPAETCTGSSYSCPIDAYYGTGVLCYTGSFNIPGSGSCQRSTAADPDKYCSGGAVTCTGATSIRYDNGSLNQVWNGSAWAAASASNQCGYSGYLCSGQQIYRYYYGCNASGSCNSSAAGTTNGSLCSGEGTANKCVDGNSTCQSNCSDGIDNDGDSYIDGLDSDCVAWACTSGDCCDLSTHQYKAANTVIGTCMKCTGSSNTSVAQTSSQDLGGNCATGAAGSATACQSNNCSGSGDSCGYVGAGTTCRALGGPCDINTETCTGSSYSCPADSFQNNTYVCNTGSCPNPTSGACSSSATDTKCSGSSALCNGSTVSRACNAPSGQVGNGSTWVAASSVYNCGTSAYKCSGQQIYYTAYGCNGSGSCSTSGVDVNGTLCIGEGTTNKCVAGNGSCQTNCSDGIDNDGDSLIDGQDTGCGGCGQCTSGSCCDTATGCYKAANTVIGTCLKCTGTSPAAVNQTSAQDLGDNCSSANGACQSDTCSGSGDYCGYKTSVCRATAGVCDPAETCSGSDYNCPVNSYYASNVICSSGSWTTPGAGACNRSLSNQYCSGSSALCNGTVTTIFDNGSAGQVWNGGSFAAASASNNCGVSGYSCSGQTIQQGYYGCVGGGVSGSPNGCNTSSAAATGNITTCSGESATSKCVNGNGTCQNNCSDGIDNDSDGYIDGKDSGCGGCGQCTSGDCCNTTTGCYKASGCLSGCLKCTGNSANSVVQSGGEDLCNFCPESPAGPCEASTCDGTYNFCGSLPNTTTCRASYGVCDPAEKCTGGPGSHDCPVNSYYGNTVRCSTGTFNSPGAGSCGRSALDIYCYGDTEVCDGNEVYRYDYGSYGTVWNGSSWASASASNYCGTGSWACSGQQNYYPVLGCNGGGSCNVSAGTVNGLTCDSCQTCTPNNTCPTIQYTGYKDYDKDGYGTPGYGTYYCSSGYNVVQNGNDCNDSNSLVTTPTFLPDAEYCSCNMLCGGASWTQYDFSCNPVQTHQTTCYNGCPSGIQTSCWIPRNRQFNFTGYCVSGSCSGSSLPDAGSCSVNTCWGGGGMEP